MIFLFLRGRGEILNFAFQWIFLLLQTHLCTHTHKKVFSLLYKAQFKAAFRNKRQNKCYCYSQYTDVYSYLPPPPFLYFYYCLFGDIISRTCLFIVSQRLLFSGTGAYYVVTRWNSNNLPPPVEVLIEDNERNHIVFCWH